MNGASRNSARKRLTCCGFFGGARVSHQRTSPTGAALWAVRPSESLPNLLIHERAVYIPQTNIFSLITDDAVIWDKQNKD